MSFTTNYITFKIIRPAHECELSKGRESEETITKHPRKEVYDDC